jgi:hypothetical protein
MAKTFDHGCSVVCKLTGYKRKIIDSLSEEFIVPTLQRGNDTKTAVRITQSNGATEKSRPYMRNSLHQ